MYFRCNLNFRKCLTIYIYTSPWKAFQNNITGKQLIQWLDNIKEWVGNTNHDPCEN